MKNRRYAISAAIIVLVIIVSIAIPLQNNKNEITPIQIANENNGLPKLNSFEDLYNISKDITEYNKNDTISIGAITENTEDDQVSTDYSETNIQVEGVDEADIVKTDGEFIYYVTNTNVVIVNTSDENMKLSSQINLENENFIPNELYVYENKLVVIGNTSYGGVLKDYTDEEDNENDNTPKVVVLIYNVEKKSKPLLEREITVEGTYMSSRMIGENLYFISNKNIYHLLFIEEKEKANENNYKPVYTDSAISTEKQLIDFKDISYFPEAEELSYLIITGFNICNNDEINMETYLGAGKNIYCSKDYLYIAKEKYDYKDEKMYGYYSNFDLNTYIYKFKLDDSKVSYESVGSVPGYILNQFSMDEKNGHFRIATTNNSSFNNETNVNNLYILDENLKIIGKIENLARGEKIYSVRFIGNRAYMVTFVQTDPLFVIDLEDETNPTLLGELEIPGYSNYLHPYDETHLIGFGENTTTNESGGVVSNGMKIALFDVSNPAKPKEMFSMDIGEKGTFSDVLYNHKALLFSKEKNLIAFPVYISKSEEDNKSDVEFQGAIVYSIDIESGFNEKGRIAHKEIEEETFDYDYSALVERIIYIEDKLYTLSNSLIIKTDMETMEEEQKLEL